MTYKCDFILRNLIQIFCPTQFKYSEVKNVHHK